MPDEPNNEDTVPVWVKSIPQKMMKQGKHPVFNGGSWPYTVIHVK